MRTGGRESRGLPRRRRLTRVGLGSVVALTLVGTPAILPSSPTGAESAWPVAAVVFETAVSVSTEAAVPDPPATTSTTSTTVPPPAPEVVVTPDPVPVGLPTPLEVAQGEVGGPEARYSTDWGFGPGFWCAKFVSWVLAHAGVAVRDDGPGALKAGVPAVDTPVPGDLVFIDLMPEQGTGQVSHVGIVESVNADGSVATIEGNAGTSDLVTRNVRQGAEIVGYGRPPAPTSVTVIPAPPPPAEGACIWIEIGKPWLCDWKPSV